MRRHRSVTLTAIVALVLLASVAVTRSNEPAAMVEDVHAALVRAVVSRLDLFSCDVTIPRLAWLDRLADACVRTGRKAVGFRQARPRDLRCFFDFLRPIVSALPITDRNDRPSWSATSCVLLFANSFLSCLTSSFDHKPVTSFFFFAITRILRSNRTSR